MSSPLDLPFPSGPPPLRDLPTPAVLPGPPDVRAPDLPSLRPLPPAPPSPSALTVPVGEPLPTADRDRLPGGLVALAVALLLALGSALARVPQRLVVGQPGAAVVRLAVGSVTSAASFGLPLVLLALLSTAGLSPFRGLAVLGAAVVGLLVARVRATVTVPFAAGTSLIAVVALFVYALGEALSDLFGG